MRPSNLEDDVANLQTIISAEKLKECLGVVEPSTGGDSQGSHVNESVVDELSCRNQLVAARKYAIDLRFSQFEENLFRETRESGFGATLATLGLTTAGAFASGGTSQVLSGISAFIIGGRQAFEKEVLAERTLIAIHTAMRANRTRVSVRIRMGLRESIDQYPLAIALSDLNDYYDAGTILGALVGITESVGTQAREQSRRLENASRGLDPDTGKSTTGKTSS